VTSSQRELKQRARQAGHGQPMEHVVAIVAGAMVLAAVVLALVAESDNFGWQIRLYVVVVILGAAALYGIGRVSDRAGRWCERKRVELRRYGGLTHVSGL